MPQQTSRRLPCLAAAVTLAVAGGCTPGLPAEQATPGQSSPLNPLGGKEDLTLYRFDESRLPVEQRRTDPRVEPPPDRRLLTCDAGTPPDWPIVDYLPGMAVRGVEGTRLGYLQRAGARRQLTIDGCPIYRHRGDRAPGHAAGEGLTGTWFALEFPSS